MTNIRVRFQIAPWGLLRVVPPGDGVVYLAIGAGDRLLPIWEQDDLSLFIAVTCGPDGEPVIDLVIVEQGPDAESAAAAVA